MKTTLNMFINARILQQIGHARITRFLDSFEADLNALNLSPPPSLPATHFYFGEVADFFANTDSLPAPLLRAVAVIETAAAPEHAERLNALIHAHIPNCTATHHLDRALELWFSVPEALECFAEATPIPTPQSTAQIINHKSEIENSAVASPARNTHHAMDPSPSELPSTTNHEPPPPDKQILNQKSEIRNFADDSYAHDLLHSHSILSLEDVQPWPEPVNGKALLDALVALLRQFIVLPKWAAETLALWIIHTYLFKTRDVTTYIGIESPEKRCGKTTLLTVLSELVSRPVVSTNISSPAFFRVIEEVQPTLLIDEADTFFQGNTELRGILNSGYKRKTSFVVRVTSEAPNTPANGNGSLTAMASRLARFSCWCPKAMAAIGRFPDTLADRCIVIRMQRKTTKEECERLRNLETTTLRRQCARFALDNAQAVGSARPDLPSSLNDRAADIWEPLLAIADLAGGDWPQLARQAAINLAASAQDHNPIGTLLFDIFLLFTVGKVTRIYSRELVQSLNTFPDRPWSELRKGKPITELWLAQQLRPYGVRPKTIWIENTHAKGYTEEDFQDVFRRYVPKSELESLRAECRRQTGLENKKPESGNPPPAP